MKALLVFLVCLTSPLVWASEECDSLFASRGDSLEISLQAQSCLEKEIKSDDRLIKANALNKLSYLKFFMAEFFFDQEKRESLLLEGINLGEKSVLLFGPKYSIPDYQALTDIERKTLAQALYNYGLTISRYIDIKGQWEAIKRMEDIKRSMNSILRIKEEATAFHGAHRTLGIFHMKVPTIAGGKIESSEEYLKKAVTNTLHHGGVSLYPSNNSSYADLLHKLGRKKEGCEQLKLVASLTAEDIKAFDNGLYYESLQAVAKAKDVFQSRKCQ